MATKKQLPEEERLYAITNESDESFVGNLYEIREWIDDNNTTIGFCTIREVGDEVSLELKVVQIVKHE